MNKLAFAFSLLCVSTCVMDALGEQFNFDPSLTQTQFGSNKISTDASIQFSDGSGFIDNESKSTLIQSYQDSVGTHDWGLGVHTIPLSIGDISSAANGAVSLDGDGTSQLHIHLAGEASSSGTLAPQRSNTTDATTSVYMYLVINLNGLVPAQSYQISADWSYSTDAAGPNSGFGAISGGHLGTSFEDFSVGPMTTVFERTISGNTGQPPAHGMDSGSTTIDFVPTASSEELDLILTATCTVDLSGHTGNFDMSDATFSGDATLTIVPEPSSLALLSLGTLCLCLFLLLGTRRLQALLGRRWVLEESSVRRI